MENLTGTSDTTFDRIKWFVGLNLIWLLLCLLTVWLGWRSTVLTTSGTVAEGRVVRWFEDNPSFDSDFTPVVEFQVDGKTYTVQSQNTYRWWNRYLRFPLDGEVEIRYDPANPERAEINSWWDIWSEALCLGIFTIIAAFAVNVYLRFRWRAQQVV